MINLGRIQTGIAIKSKRNFCLNLLRKTKKDYFQGLNVKDLSENKNFGKTIKYYFSNKSLNSNKLLLKEEDLLIRDEKQLANLKELQSNNRKLYLCPPQK